jgi:hypothetical protein
MGEAKRRGTEEQRVRAAMKRGPRVKRLSADERRKLERKAMERIFYSSMGLSIAIRRGGLKK